MTHSRLPFLPYGRQNIDEADIEAVVAALRSDWLTGGPAVDAFERALEEEVGAPHAVVCSSGTAALHLAALALELGPGDKVIVPSLTFVATANAARYVGADVEFCDVDPETGLATVGTIEAALDRAGPAARALFVVHLNGQAADMSGIGTLARSRGLAVVEDACHAIGSSARTISEHDQKVGSGIDGGLTVFSFHPVKTITAAEGGAVTTRNRVVADRLRRLRGHGITRDPDQFTERAQAFDEGGNANPWYYEQAELGLNYRISDMQCALGLSQMRRLRGFIERRAELVRLYDRRITESSPSVRPIARNGCGTPAWHLYPVLIDFVSTGVSRATVMKRLRDVGVGSQVHYLPVHLQPYYVQRYGHRVLPGAEAYYARCLSLPLFPSMTDDDVDVVVDALTQAVRSAAA